MKKNNLIISNLLFLTRNGEITWKKESLIDGYVYVKELSNTKDVVFEIENYKTLSYINIYMIITNKNEMIKKIILPDYNSSDVDYLYDLIVLNELQDELKKEIE